MNAVTFVLTFFGALVASVVLVPMIIRFATVYGLYDIPDITGTAAPQGRQSGEWRRVHRKPIPRLGGVAIVFSFFIAYAAFAPTTNLGAVFVGSLAVFFLGLADDIKHLSASFRFIVQAAVASYTVYVADLAIEGITLHPDIGIPIPNWLGSALAVFFIVGAINAINMIDGLDGLAVGVVLIGISLLSLIYYLQHRDPLFLLVFTLPLAGAILGFLRYNTHPAAIFMGDSGSNWLGFMVGVFLLVIVNGLELEGTPQGLLLTPGKTSRLLAIYPLSTVALPIFDTISVIVHRYKRGINPASADRSHFHHTLMRLGLSHSQSVMTLYFVSLIVGLLGVIPVVFPFPEYNFWWLPYLGCLGLLAVIVLGLSSETKLIRQLLYSRLLISKDTKLGARLQQTIRYWEAANKYTIYAILFVLPVFAGVPQKGLGYLCGVATSALAVSYLIPHKQNDFIESFVISFGVGILLVVNNQNAMSVMLNGEKYNIQFLYNYAFVWLAVSTVAFLLLTMRKRYLYITPSDFLLTLLPIVLIAAPEPYNRMYQLDVIGLRCLVFFMAIRAFAKRNRRVVHHVKLLSAIACIYVVMTSLYGLRIIYQ